MAEPAQVALRDIAAPGGLVGGPFGSSLVNADYTEFGVPVIRGSNFSSQRYVTGPYAFVSIEKFTRDLARNSALPGDVVFTQRGTLGQVAVVPASEHAEFVISQSQMRLRAEATRADNTFVYYAACDPRFLKQVTDRAISTGVPHINLGILAELTIPLPALPQQRAIAEVLGALDDKIAANTRQQRLAWATAAAHFHGLRREQGEMLPFSDFLDLKYGKSLPASRRQSGPVAVYGSGGIVGSHSVALSDRGVIVGRKGTAGSVMWSHRPFFAIDTTYIATPKDDRTTDLFCYFALSNAGLDQLNSDSAVPGLNRHEALAQRAFVPARQAVGTFSKEAMRLIGIDDALTSESESLARTRDALLPALMSGKLRVRDAERTVEQLV